MMNNSKNSPKIALGTWSWGVGNVGGDQVYRLRDINAVDHSGNREYAPKFITNDKKEAEAMAIAKNKETDDAEKDA